MLFFSAMASLPNANGQHLLQELIRDYDLHVVPIKVGWYNQFRRDLFHKEIQSENANFSLQLIDSSFPEHMTVYIIYQGPEFFEKAVLPFYKEHDLPTTPNILDHCLSHYIEIIKNRMESHGYNLHYRSLDEAPYLHSQSLGHVSGVFQYIHPDQDLPDTHQEMLRKAIAQNRRPEDFLSTKPFGLCVHPKFGGWFAFRGLCWFAADTSNIEARIDTCELAPTPAKFLSIGEIERILYTYNVEPDASTWRDLYNENEEVISLSYSPMAFLYFHERRADMRKRFLQIYQRSEKNRK